MKALVSLILIFIGVTSAFNDEILTLDQWYNQIQQKHPRGVQDDPFSIQLEYLYKNKWCIENEIKYYDYKQKKLNFAEAMILIYGAGLNCFEYSTRNIIWKKLILLLIDHFQVNPPGNNDCFMLELKKMNSEVLWNFDPANVEVDANTCEKEVDNAGFSEHIQNFKENYGNVTCDLISEESIKKLLLTTVVLSSDGLKETKDSYANSLGRAARKMMDDSFTCVKNQMFSRGHQWTQTTSTHTVASNNNNNINRNTESQASSANASAKEKVYWYQTKKWYDVSVYNGVKWLYDNPNWIRINEKDTNFFIKQN